MSTRTPSPRPSTRLAVRTSPSASKTAGNRYRAAWWVGVGVLAALLVASAVVVINGSARSDPTSGAVDGAVAAPGGLTEDGWVRVGDGPVTVSVYFDYLCPACGAFEDANGEALERLLRAGDVTIDLRPIAFLDRLSAGTRYSTRAANALATVVDADPRHAWAFHRALYATQPEEGSKGLTDQQLADVARDVGVPDRVSTTFAQGRFEEWVAERTETAFASGVEGTPTILVDGREFDGDPYQADSLVTAVEQAAG